MGSGRFNAKATLEDILMKPFDWVACEGLRSQGSKCRLSYSLANLGLVTLGQIPHIYSSQQLLIFRVAA